MGLNPNPLFIASLFLFLSSFSTFSFSDGALPLRQLQQTNIPEPVEEGENGGMVDWGTRRLLDEAPKNSTILILAAERTRRKDPSKNFEYYTGGWDIKNSHYIYSVAYTATTPFFVAVIWFFVFGLILCCLCLRRCCCCVGKSHTYSKTTYRLALAFLTIFTISAVIGTMILYTGEHKFHSSIADTLAYILHQADSVIENTQNMFSNLLSAKKVLPEEFQEKIDNVKSPVDFVANSFRSVTKKSSDDILKFLKPQKFCLIATATFLLILAILGFVFSILGFPTVVYVLAVIGWLTLVGTFITSGIFLVIHNVVADTCVAMDDWVQNPGADSALQELLPKVRGETAQKFLSVSKSSTVGMVGVINADIANNVNIQANSGSPIYYNQSGPMLPVLCSPYDGNLTDRHCAPGEVAIENATEVWKKYICKVSLSGKCITTGRLTPDRYDKMLVPLNVTHNLHNFTPFLMSLMDSTFAKETFTYISKEYCPKLALYSKLTYDGFIVSSVCVMLSIFLWVIYARARRQRKEALKEMRKAPKAPKGGRAFASAA